MICVELHPQYHTIRPNKNKIDFVNIFTIVVAKNRQYNFSRKCFIVLSRFVSYNYDQVIMFGYKGDGE